MEAPEKIYVDSKAIGDNISTTVRTLPQDYPTCTEYIRTDAFIEKAVSYLNSKLYDWVQTTNSNQRSYANTIMRQDFIEDFKN